MKFKAIIVIGLIGILALAYFGFIPGNSGNVIGVAFTINYADGSSREIDPLSTIPLKMYKQTITDTSGKVISSILWKVNIRATWVGTYQSHTLGGAWTASVGATPVRKSGTITYTGSLPQDQSVQIASGSITATEMAAWATPSDTTVYTLNLLADVSLTIYFTSGDSSSLHGDGSGAVQFRDLKDQILTLNVIVSASPVY